MSFAADWIHSQVCGYGRKSAGSLIVFWRAYCDESTDDDWFIIGGYVATAETWDKFSCEWEDLLSFLPSYMDGVFKMSDLMGSDYYSERALAFYRLIENADLISMSCTLRKNELLAAFDEVIWPSNKITNWSQFRRDLTNPYIFAVRAMVLKLTRVQVKLGVHGPVNFVFDERSEQQKILNAWHHVNDSVPDDIKRLLGSTPVFDREDRSPPLQAADMWAWLVRVWQRGKEDYDWAVTEDPAWPWLHETALKKGFRVSFNQEDLRTELEKTNRLVRHHLGGLF